MKRFSPYESGQGILEYVLIIILVGVIIYVLLTLLGPAITQFIQDLAAPV
ncbi:MAG TPA: pilus assembly protein [Flexilinea sp.]|jgi:pilus assembly protein Flp/PilA|nr:pilus assembly protein [Flexilinea sp.]OQA27276.1 MAG: hypothetical protein BWY58_00893 [Chloroflexi bacterium ADurb.Bin344]HNY20406.1 pilus assembly protein [Flexilinea sp.]HNY94874.1 pilus assembly protein [Flexilinea sp.]HOG22402.1 pilus assembly protein [Flexilinea sp.]